MNCTLLILSAGMGSRYGGLKQIDPVGPNGELIIDYSIYDAKKAGFNKIVFVIRKDMQELFRQRISGKLENIIDTQYAFQQLDSCLEGQALPESRQKPWGTGHAVLVAKDIMNEPFAVINADDYYGANSFRTAKDFLEKTADNPNQLAMVGFQLKNTLSEHGTVSRGVCTTDDNMFLKKVTERTKIKKTDCGAAFIDEQGGEHQLSGNEIVSMNMWAFKQSVFADLQTLFNDFLKQNINELKSEFYIPFAVDSMISRFGKTAKVLTTSDSWFGVTYMEDKDIVKSKIANLIQTGVYPENLWG